jgi:demethylmenaquinone methyltransferase/2-methoxy-6-polyprenyl-1,4-benzoquinol methylase
LDADQLNQEEWASVIRTIESVVDYYDRMNNLVTFFRVEKWRRKAGSFSQDGQDILEIGCGPGSFTKHLKGKRIVCVDPSEKLIAVAKKRIAGDVEFRQGEAEHLPVDSGAFDRVFCSFSFRDFKDKRRSLGEIFRVLRNGGQSIILEIAKPKGRMRRALMNWHLRYDVPLLAHLIVPSKILNEGGHNIYKDLWTTYQKYGTADRYAEIMREIGFKDVAWEELTFGGAVLLRGTKT